MHTPLSYAQIAEWYYDVYEDLLSYATNSLEYNQQIVSEQVLEM